MANDADETIITRFVVEASQAIQDAEAYRAKIDAIKVQIKTLAEQSKMSFKDIAEGMKSAFAKETMAKVDPINMDAVRSAKAAISDFGKSTTTALSEIQKEAGQTGQSFRLFGVEINNVGSLAKVVLLGIFGVSVMQMFRNLINTIQEATKAGYEFAKAIFQLEVGARALQRAGVDVTIEQIYEQIGTLQERFKIFTTKDLVVGTAAFLNLNRDMGFTREQLFKLQDAIATLAVVNGRAMDEVQRTVALALSSGYTEGLQRLGVSINRVNIAQEAARLGFAKSYMSLTEQQRALATYNLIIQKTAVYQDDLTKYYDTAPGAIDRTKTSFQELKNQMGLLIATNLGLFLRDINRMLDQVNSAIDRLKGTKFVEYLTDVASAWDKIAKMGDDAYKALNVLGDRITALGAGILLLIPPLGAVLIAIGRIIKTSAELKGGILGDETVGETERQAKKIEEAVSNALENLETFQKEYGNKVKDYEKDYLRDLEKLERDNARRRIELARDLARDLAKIERDGIQKREDLQRDYYNRLRDIDVKLGQDIAEENAKYALEIAQTNRESAIRRAELEAQYRENEKKAEIRFQEDMRRLREGFLFDLEDALHERDARQVLRLIRQYNLQKTQTERQFEIEKDERARAFRLEMQQLEAQRQERLRILAEEHAARIASLQAQAAYERELAARKYAEDKAELERQLEEQKQERIAKALEAEEELKRRLEEAKADRKLLLEQQIADLNAERDRLLEEIGNKLWGTLQETTDAGLQTLYKALVDTLGPGGDADAVFKYYVKAAEAAAISVEGNLKSVAAMMAQLYAFVAQLNALAGGSTGKSGKGGNTSSSGSGGGKNRQAGGPVYEGEVYKIHKDETFVPAVNGRILNVQQSQQAVAGAYTGLSRGMGEGKVKIGIALSDGLVGEIIDMAGDVVSDVVFDLNRKRR